MRKRLPNGCYRTGLIFNKQVFKEVAQLSHLFFCAYLPGCSRPPSNRTSPQPRLPAPSPGSQPPAVRFRLRACGLMLAVLCFWLCVCGLMLQALCFRPCVADPFLCWCAGIAVVCHLPRSPYVSLPYRPGALLVLLVHSSVPALQHNC